MLSWALAVVGSILAGLVTVQVGRASGGAVLAQDADVASSIAAAAARLQTPRGSGGGRALGSIGRRALGRRAEKTTTPAPVAPLDGQAAMERLLAILLLFSLAVVQGCLVNTTNGPVLGQPSPANASIRSFIAIPYAAAPVGSLRWQPPQLPAPWTSPLAVPYNETIYAAPTDTFPTSGLAFGLVRLGARKPHMPAYSSFSGLFAGVRRLGRLKL